MTTVCAAVRTSPPTMDFRRRKTTVLCALSLTSPRIAFIKSINS